MFVQPMVIECEYLLEHVLRHATEKALDRAVIKRRAVGGRERMLAAAPAYERQRPTVAAEKIDADRNSLRVGLEAVDDTVRIAEQNARKGPQRRALARFVMPVDEVKSWSGAKVERIAGKMTIGTQVEGEDAHHASSSAASRAANRGRSLSRASLHRPGVSIGLRERCSFNSPGSLLRNGSSSLASSGPISSVLPAISCMMPARSCASSFDIASRRSPGGVVLLTIFSIQMSSPAISAASSSVVWRRRCGVPSICW